MGGIRAKHQNESIVVKISSQYCNKCSIEVVFSRKLLSSSSCCSAANNNKNNHQNRCLFKNENKNTEMRSQLKAPDLAEYIKHSGQEKLSLSASRLCDFYKRPQNPTTILGNLNLYFGNRSIYSTNRPISRQLAYSFPEQAYKL